MVVDTVIEGGTLVTSTETVDAAVAIDDETIVAVGDRETLPAADRTIDASGTYVLPGVVDPHTHLDDHFSMDSYETGTSAAALGGVTTLIDFAWQAWVGELSDFESEGSIREGIERKREKAADSLVDYSFHGAITREDEAVLDEIATAVEAGVPSFKMFTAYEIGLSNGFMERVFEEVAAQDGFTVVHTEDETVCDERTARLQREGKGDARYYPESRPDHAEAMAAEDAVRLATEAGCKYYGFHTSCREAADVLADFRQEYPDLVRAETCTHYTTLDDSVYERLGNLPMIAPPIRTDDDIEAMFDHLSAGSLDVVSTDHCAYTRETKQVENWWDSSFGGNSLQTSLPVFYDEAVNERGYDPSFVVEKLCRAPSQLFGLPQKGTLAPGTDADVVVFDPSKTRTISETNNASVADFSLYDGREVTGAVKTTLVRGRVVADDGEIVADPGHGEFVARETPTWKR
jgi:dihydropyrimidinase